MLGLFSAKSGHPLADAKEAKRVLGELSMRDAATALDEVSGWLESVAGDEVLNLADRLALGDPHYAFAGGLLSELNPLSVGLCRELGLVEVPHPRYSPVLGAALLAMG